eukprot:CCRYP_019423-RA/>CCRYP_019423-RA protein AED:0.46 eAED:1.00 QI:0/-1/0/1/-1/0/1/0/12
MSFVSTRKARIF